MRCGSCGVLVREGKVLLGLRSTSARSHHGKWDVIGGHREQGESAEQTLVRELWEELGVTPTRYECLEVLTEGSGDSRFQLHIFVIREWRGTPVNNSDEHTTIGWHAPSELLKLDLSSASLIRVLSKIVSP